jgi:TIR domain
MLANIRFGFNVKLHGTMYRLYLIHSGSAEFVQRLANQIESDLRTLGCDPAQLEMLENQSSRSDDAIALGLYIASIAGRSDESCCQQVKQLITENVPVVPLVEASAKFDEVVPDLLHPINALERSSLSKVSAAVLRWLGLTEKQRRVFVSYRRSDSLLIGEQLWETLSKAGFEVFLDRFSVDPGVDFQERLTEALSDKAFLLLVESPDVTTSKWVEYEVEYARKTRMGLIALTWPGSAKMKNVFEKQRHHLVEPAELETTSAGRRLTIEFLKKLPDLVEQVHAQAMLARRRRMMGSIESELRRNKVGYKLLSDWTLLATALAGDDAQLFSITPRPPEIPDLFLLDTHCGSAGVKLAPGVLVHTAASLREDRKRLLEWAIATRNLALVNEDQIVQAVEKFAAVRPGV